ncbi:hypothetical protein [Streptomyces californicus]|uniref:hypothetical protein n=1 Tax=Streptomyces californicus TaxID=67351 RepID=UPI00296F85E5|nr:hypothetical protein [Streptomyces californicus]MDW4912569.1 hypothetical protein [Streptomyces californicus]
MGLTLYADRPDGSQPTDPLPQWSWTGFSLFRRALAAHINIDLDQMNGFGGGTDWDTVSSPLRHLLQQPDDSGYLEPEQVTELAPALRAAVTALSENDPEGFLWTGASSNGRSAQGLITLLEMCAAENLPVRFR